MAKKKKLENEKRTPALGFRFMLEYGELPPYVVAYVKSLPGRQMEIGYCSLEDGPKTIGMVDSGDLKQLDSKGNIIRKIHFSGRPEALPFDFDYTSSRPMIARILLHDVTYTYE